MSSLFVGIDLGGTGTRAALATAEGQLLASGRGGPAGHDAGEAGRRRLGRALDAALASIAPFIRGEASTIHAGTTGLSLPGRRERLTLELSSRFPKADVRVSNDALIALRGGLAGREGVAVLAGSGSIALARSADGREARAGGWGYLLGDEGGGFWLGREAVATYLSSREGVETVGGLSQIVGEAIRLSSVPDVLAWAYSDSGAVERLAQLAPLVSRAAGAGDPSARDIMCRAALALANLAVTATRQLWPAAPPQPLQVVCCGGVWAAGEPLATPFAEALAAQLPNATIGPPLVPPVAGALLMAMDADKMPRPQLVYDQLIAAFRRPRRNAQ